MSETDFIFLSVIFSFQYFMTYFSIGDLYYFIPDLLLKNSCDFLSFPIYKGGIIGLGFCDVTAN